MTHEKASDRNDTLKQLQQESEALGLYDEKTKPCPFCNDPSGTSKREGLYYAGCQNYHCRIKPELFLGWDTEAEAIAAWNTRAERDVLDEVLGELEFSSKSYFTFEELKQIINRAKGAR
jgi:hypothetical protein